MPLPTTGGVGLTPKPQPISIVSGTVTLCGLLALAMYVCTRSWRDAPPLERIQHVNHLSVQSNRSVPSTPSKHFTHVNASFLPSKPVGYSGGYPSAEDLFMNMTLVKQSCGRSDSRQVLAVAGFDETSWLHTFICSWRVHSPETQIILFSLSELFYDSFHDPDNSLIHVITVKYKPENLCWNNWRIFLHARYLETCMSHNGVLPDAIMVSDGRDAALLGPLWQHPTVQEVIRKDTVLFAMEGAVGYNTTVANGGANAFWVQSCFEGVVPSQMLDQVMDSIVSCSGTTLGAGQAMLRYAQAMVMTVMEIATSTCLENNLGSDQGVHNFVLHWLGSQGLLDFNPVTPRNGYSPIYTAGIAGEITMDRYGAVHVMVDGKRSYLPYIHQYNRMPEFQDRLDFLYNVDLKEKVLVDNPFNPKPRSWRSRTWGWLFGRRALHTM